MTAESHDLRTRVQRALDDFLAAHTPLVQSISPDLEPLTASLTEMLRGGKRLRPSFAYWGYRAVGGADSDALVTACSSLELLQACALIHDDVMDASDTRRGRPAVHRQFEQRHAGAPWHGNPGQFGLGAAILVGDLALSWADEMLMTCGLPDEQVAAGKRVYDLMRTELMAGQYLDLVEQNRRNTTVDRALTVIRYKSAKYSIEQPLLMGAHMHGCANGAAEALSRFGLAVGEAFQLRDDLLGVFGDSAVTGKPSGDDVRERKQTVLVALAIERGRPELRALLDEEPDDSQLDDIRALIEASGAVGEVEMMITSCLTSAHEALVYADFDDDGRQALIALAEAATRREA